MVEQAMMQGAKRQPIRHLVGSAVRVPTDVCGIDPYQAVHQAQREAADAALGKVRLEHCGTECHVTTAGGHRGAEPGGAAATQAMLELVQGRTLRCELDGDRTHDRCVGVCYLNGADIAAVMVHRGVARDCPRFSQGRYAEAELQAAADGATIQQTYRLPGYRRRR